MVTEQNKTLKALEVALQMEVDGKEYYLKLSRESRNELGKKLMRSLAAEEDVHQQKFREIFSAVRSQKGWPATDFQPDGGKRLRTIFARVVGGMTPGVPSPATELEAIQIAIGMEDKTHNFYKSQGEGAAYAAERAFYAALAAEEGEHRLILLDYYEYLKDPAGWFALKERPSLDGG